MDKDFSPETFFDLENVSFKELFKDIENVWEVLPRLETFLNEQFEKGRVKANYEDKQNVYIGEGTRIQKGAEIIGPAIIGKNCVIGHAALLRGNCLLGDNVHIGHAVEIKNSIFLNKAAAAHLNYVGDSIVGNEVNISGGAILANFRLDKARVIQN